MAKKNSFVFTETNKEEISMLIYQLKNSNSLGPDEIPTSILKSINLIISPILSYLFNKCIKLGEYPNCLKISKVLPLFKSGNSADPGNYRPISILSPLNKIFEN